MQHISFASKFKLYKSFVASILLYGCELWTMLADSKKESLMSPPTTLAIKGLNGTDLD